MGNVKVAFGDKVAELAGKLLDSAEELDYGPEAVRTTTDGEGAFLVPEEVADAVGVSYEVEDEPDAEGGFDASEYKGVALDEALEERGLSTEGKADEKRARLAGYEDNKE